jgi:hypothetical protein
MPEMIIPQFIAKEDERSRAMAASDIGPRLFANRFLLEEPARTVRTES